MISVLLLAATESADVTLAPINQDAADSHVSRSSNYAPCRIWEPKAGVRIIPTKRWL